MGLQAKKSPILRWGLEGVPEPDGYERTRGDNQKICLPCISVISMSGFSLVVQISRSKYQA